MHTTEQIQNVAIRVPQFQVKGIMFQWKGIFVEWLTLSTNMRSVSKPVFPIFKLQIK